MANSVGFTIYVLEKLRLFIESDMVAQKQWFCDYDKQALVDAVAYLKQFEEAKPPTHKIEVGAIVEFTIGERMYRDVVKSVRDDYTPPVHAGSVYADYDRLTVIFPASHPVAKSLASRKDGEYRTGDVVKLGGVHKFAPNTVVLGSECRDNGFLLRDYAEWVFNPDVPYAKDCQLVTPRELRTDIGDANGGEWEAWGLA